MPNRRGGGPFGAGAAARAIFLESLIERILQTTRWAISPATTDRTNHSVGEIATDQGVSQAHLSKVMQRLVKFGLLTSRRGPGGGFLLGRAPETITLLEILEAMDGPMSDNKCMLGRKKCLYGGCALGALLTHV